MPRPTVLVENGEIRLGDLFANLPSGGERVVAIAPPPGERLILDAAQLTAIAAAAGLDWRPRSSRDRILVERSSRIVDAAQIERLFARAIGALAAGREFEVELEGRLQPIHLPSEGDHRIRFEDIRLDERGHRATATLLAPTGDGGESRMPVAARLHALVDVPVLARPVIPGEPITEADLDWIATRLDRLRRGTVTEIRYLVGRTPRRPLTPGTPLTHRDLRDRILVGKGSLVTVILRSPQMLLTTRGKALEDGAAGAAIRILNTSSDRTIEGTVIGPDMVEVTPPQTLAANFGTSR